MQSYGGPNSFDVQRTWPHALARPPRPAPRDADGPAGGERVDPAHGGGRRSPLARLGEEDGLVLEPLLQRCTSIGHILIRWGESKSAKQGRAHLGVAKLVAVLLVDEALEAADRVEHVQPA